MKRYKHNLSNTRLISGDMGKLYPVCWYEVLPGDSWRHGATALLRMSPMNAPVMHQVDIRFHHWFVPNRLMWEDWEDFITGGPDGLDATVHPYIDPGAGFAAKGLADHLGVPPTVAGAVMGNVNALPFRAYSLIFNEHYRDQDLVTARAVSLASGADAITDLTIASIAWQKDRFTTTRPWAQKGAEITLPLGTQAVVKTSSSALVTGVQQAMRVRATSTGNPPAAAFDLGADITTGALMGSTTGAPTASEGFYPSNLYADLENASSVNVNDVRRAFALQRYQEARAQYGSRYPEYLAYLGVRSSDARLQRPEYLGGGKQVFSFSEVLQTAPESGDGVGNLRGHGISAVRSRNYMKFFEEHGIVMTLMSVRPRTMYVNGLPKPFLRTTREDYWQKELELIGQEQVYKKEVYAADTGVDPVLGFNDRYSDYRSMMSSVSGEFRTSELNMWHLGRIFASNIALNSDFVTCTPSKRINQVETNDVLWVMVANRISGLRMVRKSSIGRII